MNYKRLEQLQKERGITASFLSTAVGKSRYYVNSCRRDGIEPSASVVEKWAEILGTTVEYLTDQTDDPAVPPTLQNENDVRVALFGGDNVTDEQWDEIKRFIDYVRNRDK